MALACGERKGKNGYHRTLFLATPLVRKGCRGLSASSRTRGLDSDLGG